MMSSINNYMVMPMKSASFQKEFTDHGSIGTVSSSGSMWSTSSKQSISTTYIDGSMFKNHLYSIRGGFPKGSIRRKSSHSSEKKLNSQDVYLGLLPAALPTIPLEKSRSIPSSAMTASTQSSNLPDVSEKNIDTRPKSIHSSVIFDEKREPKLSPSYCPTTISRASSAWIRRHKSINESLALSNLLRDQTYKEKILLKKCSYQQLLASSSSSSSFSKYRRDKC